MNEKWVYIENTTKEQDLKLLKCLKELEKEGAKIKISNSKKQLSEVARKVYNNLKNPLSVAKDKGFKEKRVIDYNRKFSYEKVEEALKELEQEGLIKSVNGKIYLR